MALVSASLGVSHFSNETEGIILVLVYMAPAVASGPNTPEIWTKLYHYGYNATDDLWADEYFVKAPQPAKGQHWLRIPDVPPGDYLLRCAYTIAFYAHVSISNPCPVEVITLQEASRVDGAQHYPSCIQIRVTSDGKKALPGGLSFPGECRRVK